MSNKSVISSMSHTNNLGEIISGSDDSSSNHLFDSFSEKDMQDIEEILIDVINSVLEFEMIHQSSPKNTDIFTQKIVEYIHQEWIDADICTENDYEAIYEYIEDYFSQFLEMVEDELPPRQSINTQPATLHPEKLEEITQKIQDLQIRYQPTQRTQEWYEYRHNLMTASNIYKALGTDAQRNSIIFEKCKPFTVNKINHFSQDARQWGTIYEPISIMIYEHLYGTSVADFGCIQHPYYTCIGASPDGINVDSSSARFGRMIEVKNIVNREITTIPKEEYWIQMQVQMETCDLDECDFIETRFKEFESEEAFYNDTSENQEKGVYLCFIALNQSSSHIAEDTTALSVTEDSNTKTIYLGNTVNTENTPPPKYIYIPLDVSRDRESVNTWIHQQKMELRSNYVLYSTHYWYLDEFSCILVKRNRMWFQAALPNILETWSIIEEERKTGYEHRAAKKRSNSFGETRMLDNTPDPSMMNSL